MTCIESRRRGKVRGPVDYICIDADDLCRYMGSLVNGGVHQYEDGECIVCGVDTETGTGTATPPGADV